MSNYFAPCQSDVYKMFHVHAYKPGITHVYANYTNRFGKYSQTGMGEVVFVGLQYFIKEHLIRQWNEFFSLPKGIAVNEYHRIASGILGKEVSVTHMEDLHDLGFLPLEIKALPEGALVPYGVPVLTIVNTVEGFHWVTNVIETVLSAETWGISTSATTAFAYRKRFEASAMTKEAIKFMGHDFSYRGMWGTAAAAMSGFGHLCSFVGTDNIPAAMFCEKYYGARIDKELVASSIDATEHSVATSYGEEGEMEYIEHLVTNVTPDGMIALVADSYSFWDFVSVILPKLKDKIMARNGTVVIRPDSGEPVDVLCGYDIKYVPNIESAERFCDFDYDRDTRVFYIQDEDRYVTLKDISNSYDYYTKYEATEIQKCEAEGLIETLWKIFGGTIREDGLKKLDSHIGAIFGDSITLERQDKILTKLEAKGFAPDVCLGIGSYTYQYVTRDTHGSAVKATDIQFGEGNHKAIFKDPKTDQTKKSAKGLLRVELIDGKYALIDNVTPNQERGGELKPVFRNGILVRETSLEEIRNRIDSNF